MDADVLVLILGALVVLVLALGPPITARHYGKPTTPPPSPRNPNKPPAKALRPVDSLIVHRTKPRDLRNRTPY